MIDIEQLRFEYDSALDEYWYAQDLKNIAKADWKYATCALPAKYPVPAIPLFVNYSLCDVGFLCLDATDHSPIYTWIDPNWRPHP